MGVSDQQHRGLSINSLHWQHGANTAAPSTLALENDTTKKGARQTNHNQQPGGHAAGVEKPFAT